MPRNPLNLSSAIIIGRKRTVREHIRFILNMRVSTLRAVEYWGSDASSLLGNILKNVKEASERKCQYAKNA